MASRRPHKRASKTTSRSSLSTQAQKRKAQLARRARDKRRRANATHGGGATAAQDEAVGYDYNRAGSVPPELFTQSVIHVLGKEAGRAICGAILPGAPANPLQDAWGPLAERRGVLSGVPEALTCAVASFPGAAEPCRGCLANVARMTAADEAKAAGVRGPARTKTVAKMRELENEIHEASDDESIV